MEARHLPPSLLSLACSLSIALGSARAAEDFVTFESGQVRPLAMSPDGTRLFTVNTPDGRLEIFDVTGDGGAVHLESLPVGLEPVAVASRTDDEVWVVNHLSDSISIVDVGASPPRVVRTLLVGDEPRDIVFAGLDRRRAFVTTAHRGQSSPIDPQLTSPGVGRADVWIFDALDLGIAHGGAPLTIVTLFGDTPRALATDTTGQIVYAAVFHSGNRTTTVSEGAVCDGFAATPCNILGVTMPGGLPGPSTNFAGDSAPETGLIVKYDETLDQWLDQLGRDWSPAVRFDLPDLDVFAIDASASPPVEIGAWPSVGTVLFNMAVNPVSGKIYVTNTEARNEVRFEGPGIFGGSTVRGRLHQARITVIDPTQAVPGLAVSPRHLNKHIDYATVPSPPGTAERSLATPLGMALTSDGGTLYVAAFGSSKIGVLSTAALEDDGFVPSADDHIEVSGGGPSGLVLDEARGRLYVLTRFDNALSVIDTSTAREIAHTRLYNPEPQAVRDGRPVLYDARATSSNGEASCAACHVFGDLDSLAWDLGNPDDDVLDNLNPFRLTDPLGTAFPDHHPMKGPMATQSLRGMANHGPMHWRGDRSGANELRPGDALDEKAAFLRFNVAFEGLLGRGGPIDEADMSAFADFILEVTYPPNPIRKLDSSLTADQQVGRNFYFNSSPSDIFETCNGCHVLDPARGFFGGDGLSSFENEPQLFKIPHLRNMYQKVGMFGVPAVGFFNRGDNGHKGDQIRGFGFLHDGSVDTLFRFHNATLFNENPLNSGGFPNGAAGNALRRQVEAFLLAFDSDLAPIVGQQTTLSRPDDASALARIALLEARAGTGDCDLVVHGVVDGEARGWLRSSDGSYPSDRRTDPTIGGQELRGLSSAAGHELTFTCVPPGSGRRMALDRDGDGFLDRDERDAGSDPADPRFSEARMIPVGRLQILDDGTHLTSTTRPRLVFEARARLVPRAQITPAPPGSAGDPTRDGARGGGARLVVFNAAGPGNRVVLDLPAERWRRTGSAAKPGYVYRAQRPHEGPISFVSVREGRILVRGKGPGLYELGPTPQGAVALVLSLGSDPSWCATARARTPAIRHDTPLRFQAVRDSTLPATCPTPAA